MTKPYFSIIVPVFNVEDYLRKCIESILSQSFESYELILIDDGSTDRSGRICDEYSDTEQISIIHKANGGISSARNAGIEIMKGQFVIFIDSDDYLYDNYCLKNIYEQIEKFQNDVVLFTVKDIVLGTGESYFSRGNYNIEFINKSKKPDTLKYLYNSGNFPGSAWIMAVKATLIKNKELRFPIGVTAEDIGWINKILVECQSIGAVNNTIYVYNHNRNGQITSKSTESGCKGMILGIREWLNHSEINQYPIISRRMAHLFLVLLMHFSNLNIDSKKKLKKDIIETSSILSISSKLLRLFRYYLAVFGPSIVGRQISFAYKLLKSK